MRIKANEYSLTRINLPVINKLLNSITKCAMRYLRPSSISSNPTSLSNHSISVLNPQINAKNPQIDNALLTQWVENPNTSGNKAEAARRILDAQANNSTLLDLSGLRLESLPKGVNLPHVITLNIDDNQLRTIPTSFDLPNLTTLYAARNQLTEMPTHFLNIEQLFLSDNKIKKLPSPLILQKLEVFYIDNNSLTKFPKDFTLPNLIRIYAFNNEKLDVHSIETLQKQCPKLSIVESDSLKLSSAHKDSANSSEADIESDSDYDSEEIR